MDIPRSAFILLLSLWALSSWTEPAFSQCPAPISGAITAPPPSPSGSGTVPPVDTSSPVAPPVSGPGPAPIPDTSNPVFPVPTGCGPPPPPPPPPPPSPVNGVCGADNGRTLSSPPVNLCSTGTPTTVSGAGPWTWGCLGSNGGTNDVCSAVLAPPPPPPPPPPPGGVTMGETSSSLPITDGGNNGFLLAQSATLTQGGTLQSVSFYVTTPGGNLRLGVYNAHGPTNGPGGLLASTAMITPASGWNTVPVTTPVAIAAGNYWLAYETSSPVLQNPMDNAGAARWARRAFGALPTPFPSSTTKASLHWSIYATVTP